MNVHKSLRPLLNRRPQLVWLTVVSSIAFIFYLPQVAVQPTGLHWSDLFLSVGAKGGLMPSPGFPIYTLLLNIWTSLTGSVLGVATGGALLSTIFSSISLGLIYISCLLLYKHLRHPDRLSFINSTLEAHLLSGIITWIVGSSRLFWRYSLLPERYSLTLLLIALIIYLYLVIKYERTRSVRTSLIALFATLGIGISHQWLFVPVALMIGFLVLKPIREQKLVIKFQILTALTATALLPFLLLILAFNNHIPFAARLIPNLTGLTDFVFTAYLGEGLARTTDLSTLITSITGPLMIQNLSLIIKLIAESFSYWPLLLLIAGGVLYHGTKKSPFIPLLGLSTFLILAFAVVFNWSQDINSLPEIIPNLLPLTVLLGPLMWFGCYELLTRFNAAITNLFSAKVSQAVFVLGLTALVLVVSRARMSEVSLLGKTTSQPLSHQVLSQIEPDSILACFTYSSCYSLIYEQQVNHTNPEVALVPFYYLPGLIEFPHSELQSFSYDYYPMVIFDIVSGNRYKRPIYVVDMFDDYLQNLGVNFGFINYVPLGYYGQLTNGLPDELPEADYQLSNQLLSIKLPGWDRALEKTKFELLLKHLFNSSIYHKADNRTTGMVEANIASNIGQDLEGILKAEIEKMRSGVELLQSSQYYQLGAELEDVDFILDEVDKLEQDLALVRASRIAQGAVSLDYLNVEARLKWASLLEQTNASESAVREYNHVLQLEPENETALERLEYQHHLNQ